MNQVDPNDIKIGYWRDYERGSVQGQLLTLRDRDSRILIAFLALLITVTGGCLWRKWA
jgi:hypothetical protein